MLQIQTKSVENVIIFALNGRFDTYTVNDLRQKLESAASVPPAQILVDLTEVNFVDSTALAALVQGMKHSRQQGGDLRLCGLGQSVRIIFELTRLDRAFEIYVKPDEAIAAFAQLQEVQS
ncbi:MAG: STAS domain-containing protein [Ardenticatenaceae bacterium]|nr:STAS domain-containing protein [Anaerolineales bacterium]MCB8937817.1 STAS domain-containing protein [Ardenticatenaceae bacterium]MCB8974386.1 STAS domain-containing protein [Ardenticatenaceae bacterium]